MNVEGRLKQGRRIFLTGSAALLAFIGLPRILLAGAWPSRVFHATAADAAIEGLFGSAPITPSDEVALGAPMVAEDGTIVPIKVSTTLDDVQTISIVVENNPRPLALHFEVPPGTLPEIGCRIKMAETSDVLAIVRTGSGIYSTSVNVKVTVGGCA